VSQGIRLFRAHGLGNDYLVVEAEDLQEMDLAGAARTLCHRHTGVGGDGLLLASETEGADFGVRIFNPDGGEAERSGNGLRILALYLHRLGRVSSGTPFSVDTAAGPVRMEILDVPEGPVQVSVEMGRARFGAEAVSFAGAGEAVELGGRSVEFIPVSVGNPHAVVLRERLEEEHFRAFAPRISTHRDFATGVNVQFAAPAGGQALDAWVWERGAGETLASGSSACAVAAAAVRAGMVSAGAVEVRMRGGSLQVEVSDTWEIRLTGPVEAIGWVELEGDLEGRLRG
jgi:diaminopimelate epimerase